MILRLVFIPIFFLAPVVFSQQDIRKILDKASDVYDENPAESFEMCERAEREAESSGDHQFDGSIALCKSRYLILIASFDEASSELNKAIIFFQEKDDQSNLAVALSLKSLLLSKMGDLEAAHVMLLQVLDINRSTENKHGTINTLLNLSLDYKRFGQADSMRMRLEELSELTDDFAPYDYYYYYQNWGSYYLLIKDYKRAIQQFDSALKVAEEEKITDAKATCLMFLSQANRLAGNLQKADEYAEESYTFSQENNLVYETYEALVEWIAAKEALGHG